MGSGEQEVRSRERGAGSGEWSSGIGLLASDTAEIASLVESSLKGEYVSLNIVEPVRTDYRDQARK